MNKFRPQNLNKLYLLKHARVTGRRENYNWQTRIEWWPCGYRLNKITIAKQFKQLHYLACHAPDPIRKRWANAYKLFEANARHRTWRAWH